MSPAKQPGTPRDSAPAYDQTMPPGAFERALKAGDVAVAVLSADADFIETVWDVSHAHPAIMVVDAWPALLEAVGAGHRIVLLDIDQLDGDLGARLAELARFDPPPVVVTAGEARRAPTMMRMHAERRIHRLLVKPASPGKLQLLLGAALMRSRQPREVEDQPDPAGPSYRPPREAAGGGMRRRMVTLCVGMAVVFAAVVAVGLGWKSQRAAPPEVAADISPGASRAMAPGASEAAVAGSEPRAGRIERVAEPPAQFVIDPPLAPAGEPASGWSLATGADADVAPAATSSAAPDRETLYGQVERALLEDDLVAAAAALDQLRLLDPGSTRLAFLDAQLERAHQLRAVTEPVAVARPVAVPVPVAATVTEPVTEPVAKTVAEPVAEQVPAEAGAEPVAAPVAPPVVAPSRRAADPAPDPIPVAIAAAHLALDSGALEAAEMLITESHWLGADETSLGELELRLDNLRESLRRERQALLLALGRERTRDGRLIAPEADNAVHYLASLRAENAAYPGLSDAVWDLTPRLVDSVRGAIGAADWPAAEAGLDRLRRIGAPGGIIAPLAGEIDVTRRQQEYLRVPADPAEMELVNTRAPIYPQVAVRNEFEGWVDFEFIVDRDGVPRDLAIIGEQPAGVFSRAATDAVARYRYAPFVRDGVTYERLVRVRVVFALD